VRLERLLLHVGSEKGEEFFAGKFCVGSVKPFLKLQDER
jgi:hypothetical protein